MLGGSCLPTSAGPRRDPAVVTHPFPTLSVPGKPSRPFFDSSVASGSRPEAITSLCLAAPRGAVPTPDVGQGQGSTVSGEGQGPRPCWPHSLHLTPPTSACTLLGGLLIEAHFDSEPFPRRPSPHLCPPVFMKPRLELLSSERIPGCAACHLTPPGAGRWDKRKPGL